MKVKSITIETDKGDEVTMSMEDAEKFFAAMERVKEAAKPKEEKVDDSQTLEHMRLQLQMEMMKRERAAEIDRLRIMQPQPTPGQITWDRSSIANDPYKLIGGGTPADGLIGSPRSVCDIAGMANSV